MAHHYEEGLDEGSAVPQRAGTPFLRPPPKTAHNFATRTSQVMEQLQQAKANAEEVEKALAQLRERLQPVLCPRDRISDKMSTEHQELCPLAESIFGLSMAHRRHAAMIADLLHELEV